MKVRPNGSLLQPHRYPHRCISPWRQRQRHVQSSGYHTPLSKHNRHRRSIGSRRVLKNHRGVLNLPKKTALQLLQNVCLDTGGSPWHCEVVSSRKQKLSRLSPAGDHSARKLGFQVMASLDRLEGARKPILVSEFSENVRDPQVTSSVNGEASGYEKKSLKEKNLRGWRQGEGNVGGDGDDVIVVEEKCHIQSNNHSKGKQQVPEPSTSKQRSTDIEVIDLDDEVVNLAQIPPDHPHAASSSDTYIIELSSDEEDLSSSDVIPCSQRFPVGHEVLAQEYHPSFSSADIQYYINKPSQGECIIALVHPVAFYLKGCVELRVISGRIKIMGYEITVRDGFLPLVSSAVCAVLSLNTLPPDGPCPKDVTNALLAYGVRVRYPRDEVFVIVRPLKSPVLCTLKHYYPGVFSPPPIRQDIPPNLQNLIRNLQEKVGLRILDPNDPINGVLPLLHIPPEWEDAVNQIVQKKHVTEWPPRVVICGDQNTGKSTLARYLVNRLLSSRCKEVLYLDVDPGQSEFTVSTCLSLVKVMKPLLGPPWSHQLDPLIQYCFGHLNVGNDPVSYLKIVLKLIKNVKSSLELSSMPLIVNTMGWIVGLGAELQMGIVRCIQPTVMLYLKSSNSRQSGGPALNPLPHIVSERQSWLLRNALGVECPSLRYQLIHLTAVSLPQNREASDHSRVGESVLNRELQTVAYLGRLQSRVDHIPIPLHAVTPFRRQLEGLGIQILNASVPWRLILECVNGRLVSLGQAEESQFLPCSGVGGPRSVKPDEIIQCLGFGLVRGIDVESGFIYISTPTDMTTLDKVNCITVGALFLPRIILERTSHLEPTESLYPSRLKKKKRTMLQEPETKRVARSRYRQQHSTR
ncbi:unnamed protein product [Darwinula stevensoni]|uniref:Polynucleotide 5'-hydroxyl-kinase NOL9 n=1 Tax=Darwinula stevensoni TaxID=69355 RepID=A0A7R8X1R3_9CRUS|nr:unnamed protein product [Darwinula stevensoni]CAG0882542.1 unnamed protein product [Darwinula stevensoni]